MLSNLRIVMVRPHGSGNIGSVARAMKNFGAAELAIVGQARTRSFWARAMAVHGRDVLADARCYDSIRAAMRPLPATSPLGPPAIEKRTIAAPCSAV